MNHKIYRQFFDRFGRRRTIIRGYILPLLVEKKETNIIREATVHHSVDGSFAICQGRWKLLLSSYSGGWSIPKKVPQGSPEFQLYDLEKDPGETKNICESYLEVVESLRGLLIRYLKKGRSTPACLKKMTGNIYGSSYPG